MRTEPATQTSADTAVEPVLSWRGVSKSFGSVRALDDVALAVAPGEILGLVGPNGAGKSTLLGIATGLLRADSGEVVLAAGARAGFMPQEYALYPTLSAWENAMYVARSCGLRRAEARDHVASALDAMGLGARAHARVKGFSGGMRRRLSLALALLGSPRVLILDEPTAGVDPQSRIALTGFVARARERGTAVVYSTHYMEEVQAVADRVAILHEGRLLCTGSVAEVVARHSDAYLDLDLLTARPERVASLLESADAVLGVGRRGDRGPITRYRLTIADRQAALAAALRAAATAGATVIDLRLREPTLEGVFMALTGRELCDG